MHWQTLSWPLRTTPLFAVAAYLLVSGVFTVWASMNFWTGVLLAAGCKVIGNIEVGEGAKVGAGSVVLDNVPAHVTVAGVPAKIVGRTAEAIPSHDMNQNWEV